MQRDNVIFIYLSRNQLTGPPRTCCRRRGKSQSRGWGSREPRGRPQGLSCHDGDLWAPSRQDLSEGLQVDNKLLSTLNIQRFLKTTTASKKLHKNCRSPRNDLSGLGYQGSRGQSSSRTPGLKVRDVP